MRKIYIYKNGSYTSAYHQLNVIPGSDLDKWLKHEVATGVTSIWING